MKKLLLLLLFSGSLDTFAQCDPTAFVYTLSPGISKTGPVLSMEAGLWPAIARVGIMGGLTMYGQESTYKGRTETVVDLDVTGRVLYKLTRPDSDYPQLLTVYASIRGMVGVSYRCYAGLGDNALIGIEPNVSNKTGYGVNLLFTTRL